MTLVLFIIGLFIGIILAQLIVYYETKVTPFFAWYDQWIGHYRDRKNKISYICIMCFGLKIKWRNDK